MCVSAVYVVSTQGSGGDGGDSGHSTVSPATKPHR